MFDDFIAGIMEDLKNTYIDAVSVVFEFITELLTYIFDSAIGASDNGATTDKSLLGQFLIEHPANFTGSTVEGANTIWSTIEKLCNNAVVPIGGFILVVILLNDLFQVIIEGNNFKDFDDSIFIKWIIKAVCGVLLVSNVFYIASGLFAFGTSACANGMKVIFDSGSTLSNTLTVDTVALREKGLGELLLIMFMGLIVLLMVVVMIVAIIIVLASRIIEVFMYLSIAPIPMATMMDNRDWGQVGKGWIKQLLALSFQGFFIIVALGIFKTLFDNVIIQINNENDGIVLQMALLMGYALALVFTILRSGSISKSIFGTH